MPKPINWCEDQARCGAYGEARQRGQTHEEAKLTADAYMRQRKPCDCFAHMTS